MTVIAEFWESSDLKRIVESLRVITKQINFDFSKDGLVCQSLDPTHVTLVSMTVLKEDFRKYKCDGNHTIGIDLDNLSIILRAVKDKSSVVLEYTGNDKLTITTGNVDTKGTFNIAILNLDHFYVELPDNEPDCRIEINTDVFSKLIKDLMAIKCDTINFITTSNVLIIKGSTPNGSVTTFSLKKDKDVLMDSNDKIDINFNLTKLFDLSRNFKGLGDLIISLSNDNPLSLNFRNRTYTLHYYLSPLVIEF